MSPLKLARAKLLRSERPNTLQWQYLIHKHKEETLILRYSAHYDPLTYDRLRNAQKVKKYFLRLMRDYNY